MATDEAPAFAALLRRHRLHAGLSQEALAQHAGVSVRGLSDLERGVRRAPHPSTVGRLADALGLAGTERAVLAEAAHRGVLGSATASPMGTEPPAPAATEGLSPAAAALPAAPSASAPPAATSDTPHGAPPLGLAEERRWVTVLAVHLSGFAALSERLDPEDVKLLTQRCTEHLSDEVGRFGGTVISAAGDSLLTVFGAPRAHEDDAERAVRAGLAIRDAQLAPPAGARELLLVPGVGIDTGEVVAGPAGAAEREGYSVAGGAVHLAVGLARQAPARAVLVGEATYRATRERVRYRDVAARGEGEQPAYTAREALDVAAPPGARPLGTAPLVGRAEELDLLLGTWARVVREARPHLVSVLGEPGIGKSRLIAEFERRARDTGDVVFLHGRCPPYGEGLGYWALATALREAAGIVAEDDADQARRRLAELVEATIAPGSGAEDPSELTRHLALLGGLDSAADRAAPGADERALRASVRRFLEALARRRPLCVLLEDIHWGDEALLGLVEFVASRAQAAPLLVVTQARPELLERRPTWGGGVRAFTSLLVGPLDEDAGRELALALCRERGLPEEVAEQVGRAAGGNPLFAEELSATLAGGQDTAGVPSALRALILARLDGLPPAERQAIQQAAVFGKHFWEAGLAALGVHGDVAGRIDALEQHDLLRAQFRSRLPGEREYAFKHDLIREMAYQMLPRSERRRLHGQAADWLEATAGERAEEVLDLLTHHAVEAEQHDRALSYLARAAGRARRAAAHREEAALLARAIALAERSGRSELLPDLRAARGRAFASIALWTDARRELEAALDGLAPGRHERRSELLVDLSLACNWSLDTSALRSHATEALELAEGVGRADLAMGSRFWLAWASGSEGEVSSAIDQYEHALARAAQLGVSLAPNVLPLYSTALCWAGRFGPAIETSRDAVRIARAANDTDATILALQILGLALAGTGRYDEATLVFDDATHFGRDRGVGPFLARAIAMSAGFHLDVFDYEGHVALVEEARDLAQSVSFPPPLVSASIDLLLNCARRGEVGRAERLALDVAGAVANAAGWHGWLWKLRLTQAQAEIALARGDPEVAIAQAGEALRQSHGRRPKYQILALVTRGQALAALERANDALAELREAVRIARSLADPALFVRAAAAVLALDASDAVAAEAGSTASKILAALPTETMRERFRAAAPIQLLDRLAAPRRPG